ncbi:MAG: helix-turn-helix transcriptional regulator [Lachnospiraceae bacterium]|nr:helix-turn-helix transcriptional regulator [Lachnospiraceae bacterium]
MITFDPFWKMMEERHITIYDLEYTYGLNPADISRLKHNHNYTLKSIDNLCRLFDCQPSDIIRYIGHK